jgi:hypothetical protein
MIRPTKSSLQKIEGIFKDLEYQIRYEKGHFQSGYCVVESKKIAIINKFFDTEGRINCLVDILMSIIVIENLLTENSIHFYKIILKSVLQKEEQTAIS